MTGYEKEKKSDIQDPIKIKIKLTRDEKGLYGNVVDTSKSTNNVQIGIKTEYFKNSTVMTSSSDFDSNNNRLQYTTIADKVKTRKRKVSVPYKEICMHVSDVQNPVLKKPKRRRCNTHKVKDFKVKAASEKTSENTRKFEGNVTDQLTNVGLQTCPTNASDSVISDCSEDLESKSPLERITDNLVEASDLLPVTDSFQPDNIDRFIEYFLEDTDTLNKASDGIVKYLENGALKAHTGTDLGTITPLAFESTSGNQSISEGTTSSTSESSSELSNEDADLPVSVAQEHITNVENEDHDTVIAVFCDAVESPLSPANMPIEMINANKSSYSEESEELTPTENTNPFENDNDTKIASLNEKHRKGEKLLDSDAVMSHFGVDDATLPHLTNGRSCDMSSSYFSCSDSYKLTTHFQKSSSSSNGRLCLENKTALKNNRFSKVQIHSNTDMLLDQSERQLQPKDLNSLSAKGNFYGHSHKLGISNPGFKIPRLTSPKHANHHKSIGHHDANFRNQSKVSPHGNSLKYVPNSQRLTDDHKKHENIERRKIEAMRERRVVYIGNIPNDYTRSHLKERFQRFGEIENIEIKSKDCDSIDGYDLPSQCGYFNPSVWEGYNSNCTPREKKKKFFGFITFKYQADATKAIEKGNDSCLGPKLELNYGGRRHFVKEEYTDLDGTVAQNEALLYSSSSKDHKKMEEKDDDYALLLKLEQKKRGLS